MKTILFIRTICALITFISGVFLIPCWMYWAYKGLSNEQLNNSERRELIILLIVFEISFCAWIWLGG